MMNVLGRYSSLVNFTHKNIKRMKLILPLLVLVSLTILSCTEEIIVPGETVYDTVYVEKPVTKFIDRIIIEYDSILIVGDSIPYAVEVPGTDSIIYVNVPGPIQYKVDTVYRVRTVIEYDTISTIEHSYSDTLYVQPGRGIHSIPDELKPIVDEFYKDAQLRKLLPEGGLLYITITNNLDAILQAISYREYGNLRIIVNGNQTIDEMFIPLYRELARDQLNREYSLDINNPMYMFYPNNKIRYSNRSQYKSEIDKIFE